MFSLWRGSASVFRRWARDLINNVELVAIQLPGREERFGEALLDNIDDIINNLFLHFDYIDKPFVFLGHSIGALIAFEFARILRMKGQSQPKHLIVSGTKAPQIPLKKTPIHNLPEIQFIQELKKYNGIPDDILQDKEIMSIFIPIIRADFRVSEIYSYQHQSPMDFPITALGGSNDDTFYYNDLEQWKKQTNTYFQLYRFPGDHFFINSSYHEVIKIVNQILHNMLLSTSKCN